MPENIPHLQDIIKLRQQLHQYPELSSQEYTTAKRVVEHLHQYHPDNIISNIGGTGVAAVFEGKDPKGPTILFRAELDALPILETGVALYKSQTENVAHLCGHDGHMAILAGVGSLLTQQRPNKGKVILLFQPAEETGAGAWSVVQDKQFQELKPDYVFALHNLPGVPLHQIIIRTGVFAAASTGIITEFLGKPSHAAEPENGINPGLAMAELVQKLNKLVQHENQFQNLALLTVIHARLGEIAFGTNPGFATVMATLRAYQPEDFEKLKLQAESAAKSVADKYKLKNSVTYVEEFPATVNNQECVQLVKKAAEKLHLQVEHAATPFRWSEDFGHFTSKYKGALFGIGSGIDQPQLHHSDYDFPDELIETGAKMFLAVAQEIWQFES
ncbi:amidohydrolase [Pontibacter silvestris]|uniref:Amidohydrolase n=1 Tax=Pontibacter silvestris TaxID=2305183 RepID=A0ABW4WYB6_9BACT|nr:amidohydrolase [Pontibacter silvestris]MCC9137361.1 amidohydrolase [Pontibacter silvestris]